MSSHYCKLGRGMEKKKIAVIARSGNGVKRAPHKDVRGTSRQRQHESSQKGLLVIVQEL